MDFGERGSVARLAERFGNKPKAIPADKGCDRDSNREALLQQGIRPAIPSNRSRKIVVPHHEVTYKDKNRIIGIAPIAGASEALQGPVLGDPGSETAGRGPSSLVRLDTISAFASLGGSGVKSDATIPPWPVEYSVRREPYMQRSFGLLCLLSALCLSTTFGNGSSFAQVQADLRLNFAEAAAAFNHLTRRDRNELFLLLIATGDFNAMVSNDFGPRLYDSILHFQEQHDLEPTGILTARTFDRLNEIGGRIFNSWGFTFVDHPVANASIVVPGSFTLTQAKTPQGVAFANRAGSINIDFAFFGNDQADLPAIFARLTQPVPGRRIQMKVLRSSFFAVSGQSGAMETYSRYIVVEDGIAGFTMSWDRSAFPNGSRLAVVMANELYPRRMNSDRSSPPDMFDVSPIYPPATIDEPRPNSAEPKEVDLELEKARVVAVEKIRRERFARVAATARRVIDDASGFVKLNPNDANIVEYVQKISDLNGTLAGSDPDPTESGTKSLLSALNRNSRFALFAAQRAAERAQQVGRDIKDARDLLTAQKAFLTTFVIDKPTSPEAARFLPLLKQASQTVSSSDLTSLQTLIGQIDGELQQAGLADQFAARQKEQAAPPAQPPAEPAPGPGPAVVVVKPPGNPEGQTPRPGVPPKDTNDIGWTR